MRKQEILFSVLPVPYGKPFTFSLAAVIMANDDGLTYGCPCCRIHGSWDNMMSHFRAHCDDVARRGDTRCPFGCQFAANVELADHFDAVAIQELGDRESPVPKDGYSHMRHILAVGLSGREPISDVNYFVDQAKRGCRWIADPRRPAVMNHLMAQDANKRE